MNNFVINFFLGDPVYDDRKRVVGRDFGVKNMIAIGLVLYIGNSLMCRMKPKSGKRKMKGGRRQAGRRRQAGGNGNGDEPSFTPETRRMTEEEMTDRDRGEGSGAIFAMVVILILMCLGAAWAYHH